MKVLHLIHCLWMGGTEKQLYELVKRQIQWNYPVQVGCLQKQGEVLELIRSLGHEPIEFAIGNSLASTRTARRIIQLSNWIRDNRVDLLHTHDFYTGVVGITAGMLAKIPTIQSRRDLCHWLGTPQRKLLRIAGKLATAVMSNSKAGLEMAFHEDGIQPAKGVIINNGIDLKDFDAALLREPDPPIPVDHAYPTVVLVANMQNPVKRQSILIQAATLLLKRHPEAKFLLVGKGNLMGQYKALCRELGISESVLFLGNRIDVPAVLARSTVATLVSRSEGMPNAILEAMAASRPVVATAVGGATELIREGVNGYLVPPDDPAALAEKIEPLLANRHLAKQMGQKGRSMVEAFHSADLMASKFHRLYYALLDRQGIRAGLTMHQRMRLSPLPELAKEL